jgi:hypothetical protein
MSALGQKQTFAPQKVMSALPPKADISRHDRHVRFVPKADIMPSFDHFIGANRPRFRLERRIWSALKM